MITVNIHEAKARFSELIRAVGRGETVQVCCRNKPLVKWLPVEKQQKKERVFGLHDGEFELPDSFFEPMSEEELALWEGPIFPEEAPSKKAPKK